MKTDRNENLANRLAQIDANLLDTAFETDNAGKLRQYVKSKKQSGHALRPRRRAAVTGICFALLFGLALISLSFLPMLNKSFSDIPAPLESTSADSEGASLPDSEPHKDSLPNLQSDIFMDSLDKVNYYGGLKIILESPQTAALQSDRQASAFPSTNATIPAIRNGKNTFEADPSDPENTASISKTANGIPTPQSSLVTNEIHHDKIRSYNISKITMRITTAVYFCIEVTEQNTFLASKIGTGTVNIVITDLYLGDSQNTTITFKNGDVYASYVTMLSDLTDGINEFETGSYVRGFDLIDDASNGSGLFRMDFDEENRQILSFVWVPEQISSPETTVYPLTVLSDTVQVSHMTDQFTLQELNDYYIPHDLPIENLSEVSVRSNESEETSNKLESKEQMVALINCINSLEFENFFERDPGDRTGTTLIISISYTDGSGYGRATEIYLFDNTYIRRMGGCWKRISYEDSMALQNILFS